MLSIKYADETSNATKIHQEGTDSNRRGTERMKDEHIRDAIKWIKADRRPMK